MNKLVIKHNALMLLPSLLHSLVTIPNNIFIITDQLLYDLYGNKIKLLLSHYQPSFIIIERGEQNKSFASINQIYSHLYHHNANRSSVIIAFGGGQIGDLSTMAAATFNRGCFLVQIATTLLAQSDSCLGGKGAINYEGSKNMIGVFYPAHLIIVDPTLLQSLPKEEFIAGMAEVIKYAVIADRRLFEQLMRLDMETIKPSLETIIKRCLAIKALLVKKDPFDQSVRVKLNFGHTLAHALEAEGDLSHGQAVAKGMVAASALGEELGVSSLGLTDRLKMMLEHWHLDPGLHQVDKGRLKHYILSDKKRYELSIKMVFSTKIGHAVIKKIPLIRVNEWIEHL